MEIREREGVTGRRNRDVVPFLDASMAAGSSSRSFSRTSFPATVLESEHGKREEGEGVPLWWLRAWVSGWKVVGHGRATMDGGLRARGELTGGMERGGCGLGMV